MMRHKKTTPTILAMIPAKLGSVRLPMKNVALINGKPLIYYALQAAKTSGVFDKIIINAEDALFEKIAQRYKTDFYLRPGALVHPATKTDTVMYDFLKHTPCDIAAWVSPIAPLQSAQEIRRIMRMFIEQKLDSLMTVKQEQVHCLYKGAPLNYKRNEIFAQTQDLMPVQCFVYSVMCWRKEIFMREYEKRGYALLCGKVGYFTVDKFSSIIVKKPEDYFLAKAAMSARKNKRAQGITYDRIVKGARSK